MQQITVRDGGPDDVAAIVEVVEAAYRAEAAGGWTTEAHLLDGRRTDPDEVARLIGTPGNLLLLAVDPVGDVLGSCHLQRRDAETAYFGLFAVRPAVQGGGVGGLLLTAAEERASEEWGATRMVMTVLGQRPDLLAWYRRRGYEPTGATHPWPPSEHVRSTPKVEGLYFMELARPLPGGSLDQAASNG